MVGFGVFFLALTVYASWFRWRGTLFDKRWLLWIFVFAVAGGFTANELGWMAAEVGRQPWIVHPNVVHDASGGLVYDADGFVTYRLEEGLLTQNAVSESVSGGQVLGSIVMFGFIYALLFLIWVYVLNDKIQKGPQPVHPPPTVEQASCHRGAGREATTAQQFFDTTASRTLHEESMSEAKEP